MKTSDPDFSAAIRRKGADAASAPHSVALSLWVPDEPNISPAGGR
jgi:hypothetical protein